MNPTDCPMCEQVFDKRPLLQMKARHASKKYGEQAAHQVVNEALESTHDEHASYFDSPPNPIA